MYHYDKGHIYNCHKCKHPGRVPGCIYHKDYIPSSDNYPCDWQGNKIADAINKKEDIHE